MMNMMPMMNMNKMESVWRKRIQVKIKYDVIGFKRMLLVFCMLYVQCIILMLVLTAAACGVYSSKFQSDGSLALYALAVTAVNVILVMMGTAVVGLYAALKLSRFVIACHGLGLCTVVVLKMMLVIPLLLTIDGCRHENVQNLIKVFESKNLEVIDEVQTDLQCCGTSNWKYYNGSIPRSCCPKSYDKCIIKFAYIDGCFSKIAQLTKAPAIITSVAMILMIVLEMVGLSISYGLLKSIALKEGNIDFRAMFKERLEQIQETISKPFQKDGFANAWLEAIKKKTNQDTSEENEKNQNEENQNTENRQTDKDEATLRASLADFSELRSTVMNIDVDLDTQSYI